MLTMKGQIVRIISNLYTVKIENTLYDTRARGKFRNEQMSPMVGDFVLVDVENKYIMDILPRQNFLQRPVISNVTTALIITSVKDPDLSLNLLDKLLTIIIHNKIKPVICFTKLDLASDTLKLEIKKISDYYKSIGIEVLESTEDKTIKKIIKNELVVLTGQTGAGKSSLLNFLDKNLNLKTSPISASLGRGVHTTRHVELFEIAGGLIADTPGFSSISLNEITLEDLKSTFLEFNEYQCKYRDCNHLKEDNCLVKEAVDNKDILQSRYENYVKFAMEVKK